MEVFGCILDILFRTKRARFLRRRNSFGDISQPGAAEEPFPWQQNQDGHNSYPDPSGSNENFSRRTQLIQKNTFTRKIRREESVRELAGLLAASRVRQAGLDSPAPSQPWTELSAANPSHDPPRSSPPQTDLSSANPSHNLPGSSPPQTELFIASLSHDPPGSSPPQTELSTPSLSHDPPGSSPPQTELSAANPSHDPPGSFWSDFSENRPVVVNGTIIVDEGGVIVDKDRLVDEGWIPVDGRRSRWAIIVDEDGVVVDEERLINEGWGVFDGAAIGQGGIVDAGAITGEGGLIAEATRTASSANRPTSERKTPATGVSPSGRPRDASDSIRRPEKFECAICLEAYAPGDVVAWAKDGCDHIFHEACLSAWLCDHDECPLCRREVVHDDADVRFAGWH